MEKLELVYEGKAKRVYAVRDPRQVLIEFKDAATAFDGAKKGVIRGKGVCNARISAVMFGVLEKEGLPTHFLELVSDNEMLARKVEIIPLEVVVRNVVTGSMAKRFGLEEGRALPSPVLELYLKNDALGDPLMNHYHALALGFATAEELARLESLAFGANVVMRRFLRERRLELVDFKLEFGRVDGSIIIADEISPDTCRFWDSATGEKLDKDRFRRDLGRVEEAYQEVLARVTGGCGRR